MFPFLARILAGCCAALVFLDAHAAVSVTDDANHKLTLASPAHRIISLAPHATELLYAAGAGPYVVGVSEYSDYPAEARRVTSVGGVASIDLERIVALKPELVIAWGSGNSGAQIARLQSLGIPVFISEPRDFATIASSLERLGLLAGTEHIGNAAAQAFRVRLDQIRNTYQNRPPIKVFYQIWQTPLMTLNEAHLVSSAIRLCGGRNIFAGLPQLAPTVGREDVLQLNPDVIIVTDATQEALSDWRRFPKLAAVARRNLFQQNGSLMNRATPRLLDGTESLCRQLDQARSRH